MNDMSVYSSGLDLLRYWLNYLEIFQLQETNISLVSCQNYVCRGFLEWSGKCISWGAEPCGVAETWHTAHIWTPQTSRFLKNSPREFFLFLFFNQRDDIMWTPQTSIYLLYAITYIIINSSIFVFLVDLILEKSMACPGRLIMQQLAFYSRAGWKMKSKRPPSNTYLH